MLTKIIMDRLESLERDNALLKSQIRALSKTKPISSDDILKAVCAKIPKQDNDKLTKSDVESIVKTIINLKFVNKLYGK